MGLGYEGFSVYLGIFRWFGNLFILINKIILFDFFSINFYRKFDFCQILDLKIILKQKP